MSELRRDVPSAYRIKDVLDAWMQARNRILTDDPDTAGDEAELLALLGPEQEDAEDILNRLLRAAVYASDMAIAAKARAVEINTRADRYNNRAEAIRTAAFYVMDAMDKSRHELPDLTASKRAGSATVFIINEDLIPTDCMRTIPGKKEPDKKTIAARLKALQEWEIGRDRAIEQGLDPETIPDAPPDVPGASLTQSMPSLQIRRK